MLTSKAEPLKIHHWVMREAGCAAALCRVHADGWSLCHAALLGYLFLLFLEIYLETSGNIPTATLSKKTQQ